MKQRACIAIAICLRPKVIIADEPTSALDVVVQRQVMETLGRVQAELGAAVILVGHDMGLMAQFVDRLGIMYAGRLVEVAPIHEIITAPRHPYTRLLIDSLPSLERKGDAARHSRPGAAAARPAARLRVPSALSARRSTLPRREAGGASGGTGRNRGVPLRMTALLELRDVTKAFTGGVLGRERKVALEAFLLRDRSGPAARSPRWSAKAAAARPRWRGCCWAWCAPTEGEVLFKGRDLHALSSAGAARLPPSRAGDLPGPLRGVQPVLSGGPRADDAGAQVPPGAVGSATARADRGRVARRRAAAGARSSAAIRTSFPAGSGSASWWRARCCCGRG